MQQVSLPLNGFYQDSEIKPLSHSSKQTYRLEGGEEDWPDWSDRDEGERREGKPVQIHIQASEVVGSVSTRLTQETTEEEPWEDFEDTDSNLFPTAPFADSVILMPPRGSTSASVKHAPQTLKLGSSKPLKLTSTLQESTQSRSPPSWDNARGQKTDSRKSHHPSVPGHRSTEPKVSDRTEVLGDEFTIKVKKKVEQDPEVDLFADMVPDIKLSSSALLPIEKSARDAGPSGASPTNTRALETNSFFDTSTLTAKFAAANLSEVCDVFSTFEYFSA